MLNKIKRLSIFMFLLIPVYLFANSIPEPVVGPIPAINLGYFLIGLIGEYLTLFFYSKIKKIELNPLRTIFKINLITYPCFLAVLILIIVALTLMGLSPISSYHFATLICVFLLAVIVIFTEGFLLHKFIKKQLSLKKCFLLSAIMNIVNFLFGIILILIVVQISDLINR